MSDYAAISDVQARLSYWTIGSTEHPQPTTAQVQAWLDEAEALLNTTLTAAGLPAPYSDADVLLILGSLITDYAEGRTRQARSSAGGDDDDDGRTLIEGFRRALAEIVEDSGVYGAMFGGGTAPSGTRRVRGHVLDNADSLVSADFQPTIKRSEVF